MTDKAPSKKDLTDNKNDAIKREIVEGAIQYQEELVEAVKHLNALKSKLHKIIDKFKKIKD